MFMITGRYTDGADSMFDLEETNHEQKTLQQANDLSASTSNANASNCTHDCMFEDDNCNDDAYDKEQTFPNQFDSNSSGHNCSNMTEEGNLPDEELDDVAPKYDLFGDDASNAVDEVDDLVQDSENLDNVEHLSQEDIQSFLDAEEAAATARSSSQEVREHHAPRMGMAFDSDDAAHKFFNDYALLCGFAITKAGNYHGKKQGSTGHTRVIFRCNRSGKPVDEETLEAKRKQKQLKRQEKTGKIVAENSRRRRSNIIQQTGCKVKMIATLKNEKWVVITLDLVHNHDLSPPDESKFLRSHKSMTEDEQLFIRTFNSVKLPPRKIMSILRYLRGGDVPYTKKHVSNVQTAIRNECKQNDMTKVLEYFRKRKEEDPRFYYNFQLGDGKKVLSIFWSDGNSRRMYEMYGDCLSFDTTYKTNRYNLPFAPFVGVTGHGQNCLFACAIMQNETADCFKWLFNEFLDCMGQKAPVTIITDQCVSMGIAISEVFPNAVHRNCFFHIRKKADEKCGRTFATNENLYADFSDILCNSLTVEEFEFLWQEMIHKYDVGHVKYLKAMWKFRHKFVPVYFKNAFFPFIHSTARSEGTNSVFKDNVGSNFSIISFLGEYDRITRDIEEKEKEQDSITRITKPSYVFRSEIELQAGRIYNRKIFYKFQKQLSFTNKLHVDEVVKNERYEVYKTRLVAQKDYRPRRFVVLVNLEQQDLSCICCKFQKDGVVCSHILRVLVNLNISELPYKYFIDRWKPQDRKILRDKKYNVPQELTEKNRHLRFAMLTKRLVDIASEGSKDNARYLLVIKLATELEEQLDAITQGEEQAEMEKRTNELQKKGNEIDDGYGISLENPDVAKARGRPTITSRQKTIAEHYRTKQRITCSHCGSHDHNIAGCDNKHIDKSNFEKKTPKKKQSGLNQLNTKKSSPYLE
jgi:hypothetical protein